MAEPWLYRYTDFGEGRGGNPQPVLRAVVEVSTLGAPATFQAVVDTGGPITVIASDLLDSGGDPVATGTTMMLRLGGSTSEVMLYEMTLEIDREWRHQAMATATPGSASARSRRENANAPAAIAMKGSIRVGDGRGEPRR